MLRTDAIRRLKPLRFLLCLFVSAFAVVAADSKPNIVLILVDDLGIKDLHCYGRAEHHTPNVDRLAEQRMRFTNAYAQAVCSPSRAGLLTGKNPALLHITNFLPGRPDAPSQKSLQPVLEGQLPLEELTLAEVPHDAGYVSACIGKWHLGGAGFGPREQGFDVEDLRRHRTDTARTHRRATRSTRRSARAQIGRAHV